MTAFGRKTELFIGVFRDDANTVSDGFLVDSLDYEFDITRSTEFYKDSATFSIYNPNEDTLSEIMNNGVSVVFKAGYESEGVGTLFVGQIATAYPEEDGVNTKIVLVCNAQRGAQYPLQRTMIRANVDKSKSCYDVLKLIADYVGVPLSGAESLKTVKLGENYVIAGDIRSAVKTFVERKLRVLGGKVIVSNNEMIYLEGSANRATFETAYLTYRTGLVAAKPVRDERYQSSEDAFSENQAYYLGILKRGNTNVEKWLKEKKDAEAKVQPKNVVEFTSVINPAIEIGKPIYIDARRSDDDHRSVLGKYWVTDMSIKGDNFGGQFQINGRAEEK